MKNLLKKFIIKFQIKCNIELLINNAGIAVFNDISQTSVNDWDNTLSINLRGSFLMTKLFVDDFKLKKSGKIVFINSGAGLRPFKNSTAYAYIKICTKRLCISPKRRITRI